ncbi:MAG: hypothetical protein U0744_02440 [Gemmataceae bacterium]
MIQLARPCIRPTNIDRWRQQPAAAAWIEENPARAALLTQEEIDELFSHFGVGGALTREGVEKVVAIFEWRKDCLALLQLLAAAGKMDEVKTYLGRMVHQSRLSSRPNGGPDHAA